MSFVLSEVKIPHDEFVRLRTVMDGVEWETPQNRYHTADVTDKFSYKRAFLLKLPPHSSIHKHTDCGDCETDHIVLQTNPLCFNWWEDGGTYSVQLGEGYRYHVNRTVMHWATNDGETDRVHLLVEY